MATIFSKIIAGEIPSYRIHEDERYYAFLDINPLAEGHTLVIPKVETDYLFDLEDALLADMMVFAKKWPWPSTRLWSARGLEWQFWDWKCPMPIFTWYPSMDLHDIEFSRPKLKFSDEEFRATA